MLDLIVVPLDGSHFSEQALPLATRLCTQSGARLLLVRAAVTSSGMIVTNASAARIAAARLAAVLETAEEELSAVVERLKAEGLEVMGHAEAGMPAEVILTQARERGAGLIVMSTHGRSGISRYLYGSVADELLRQSDVPIVLVPPDCAWTWPVERRPRVMVTLDGSRLAEAALPPAAAVAQAMGADVLLLHVADPADGSAVVWILDGEGTAMSYLEATAERLRAQGLEVAVQETAGHLARAIRRTAREENVDVIAMATHGRGGAARVVLGSVATGVLRHTNVPLLVVRPVGLAAE